MPLIEGDDGAIRVTGTRITLDLIIGAFDAGASAEEIVLQFTTLELGAVYAVLAWAIANDGAVRAYLDKRAEEAAAVRAENERRFPQAGLRARLLARRAG